MTWPEFTFRLLGFVKAAAEIARQSAFEQRSFLMSLRPGGVADQRLRCRVLRFCGSSPKAEGAGGAEAHPQDAVLPVGKRAWGSLFFHRDGQQKAGPVRGAFKQLAVACAVQPLQGTS